VKSAEAAVRYLPASETLGFIRFAGSTLIAALSGALTLLVIRAWLIQSKGLAGAGLFDAAWTITFNYLTLFLTACSAIYLPVLTRAKGLAEHRKCVTKTVFAVLAVVIMVCYVVFVFEIQVIQLMYSREFLAAGPLLDILLVAMLMRSISWVYSMIIVAAKDARMMLISEIGFNLCLLIGAKISLLYFNSLTALGWGFVVANFIFLLFIMIYAKTRNATLPVALVGIVIASAITPLLLIAIAENLDWSLELLHSGVVKAVILLLACALSVVALRGYRMHR
jgi:O-antigen/teichoic acid export membrane protein